MQKIGIGLISLLMSSISAQPINISGLITDETGAPVSGAAISLLRSGSTATSDPSGQYVLTGSLVETGTVASRQFPIIRMAGGRLHVEMTRASDLAIDVFDLSGRHFFRLLNKTLEKGPHDFHAETGSLPSGISIIRITQGGRSASFKVPDASMFTVAPASAAVLAKASAALDTVSVTAGGYITKKVLLEFLEGTLDITIHSQYIDPELTYAPYTPKPGDRVISRSEYADKVRGFWLAQCIGNWTGLITEMDRIEPPFYTDAKWGQADERNVWGNFVPFSSVIDYYFVYEGTPWGADDDTDIEYIYLHTLDRLNKSILTGQEIREAWTTHIYSESETTPWGTDYKGDSENYLWAASQFSLNLLEQGQVPPQVSDNNPDNTAIDAQLMNESFGLYAPGRPDIGLQMAELPIRVMGKNDAANIARFYVAMHSLASVVDRSLSQKEQIFWMAEQAKAIFPAGSYPLHMYEFVKAEYEANPDRDNWEPTRDALYYNYELNGDGGYNYNMYFDGGINFAASLISLFYGEGDLARTMRLAVLAGWDADNPCATWSALIGFMIGSDAVKQAFGKDNLSDTFWIHRTRRNFPDHTPNQNGEDSFTLMGERTIFVVDRVVLEEMGGGVDPVLDVWYIPDNGGALN